MMKGKLLIAVIASAIVGFVQWHLVLGYCWMYIAVYNPIPHWLIVHGIEGNLWRSVLFVHDTIINVILCLPAAFVLRRMPPHRPLFYLAIANGGMFIYGLLLTLVMLPGASAVVGLLDHRRHA
jgi:hypothetical protein